MKSEKFKKFLKIAIVPLTIVYLVLACYLATILFKPIKPFSATFGDYIVLPARGDIDQNDPNGNSIFDNVDKNLLYGNQNEFKGKQIVDIYKIENQTDLANNQTIEIEINNDFATDDSLQIVTIKDNKCNKIPYTIKQKDITEDGKTRKAYFIQFKVDDTCYIGLLTHRGEAKYAFVIVIATIIVLILLQIFGFRTSKNKKRKIEKDGIDK